MDVTSTRGIDSMLNSRWRASAFCLAAAFVACAAEARRETAATQGGVACGPVTRSRFGSVAAERGEDSSFISSVVPTLVREQFDVFYADTLDLNCDGVPDLVGFGEQRKRGGLMFFAFVVASGDWREVLREPSAVEGTEKLVLAADLLGSGRRDVMTIASDEGGYVPRLFVWHDDRLSSLAIPTVYVLRQEEAWGEECLRRIEPRLVAPNRISLMRETIPPTSDVGHGEDCELPRDTLEIRGQLLQRVR